MINEPALNIINVAENFLSELSIPFSKKYIANFITNHEDAESIAALSSLMDDFNIENLVIKTSALNLKEIPLPAIAHLSSEKENYFVLLKQIENDRITYVNTKTGLEHERISSFESKWSGIILAALPNENSKSDGNISFQGSQIKKTISKGISLFLACLILILGITGIITLDPNVSLIPLFVLKIAGLITVLLLLTEYLGFNSAFAHQICMLGGIKKENNCMAVTHSGAGSLFGLVSMIEVGMFYFSGGILYIFFLLFNQSNDSLTVLYAMTILSLPYTLFSIYYQFQVIKKVCPLCMIVLLILWGEFITMYLAGYSFSKAISFLDLIPVIISYFLPIMIWLVIRDPLYSIKQITALKRKLSGFTTPSVLNAILKEGEVFTGKLVNTIVINENGSDTVTLILNPSCVPCQLAFFEIVRKKERYAHVRFQILFITNKPENKEFLRCLLEKKVQQGDTEAIDFITMWYSGKINKESLSNNSRLEDNHELSINLIMEEWSLWNSQNNIQFTPTIYVNEHINPKFLSIADLGPLFSAMKTS